MSIIKVTPRNLLLIVAATAILGVVCGDVGKLRGNLKKGMEYVQNVNEQKILSNQDEPSGKMSVDDIRASIFKSFNEVLAQKKTDKQLKAMSKEDKALQHMYDNFDTVLNRQDRTDWGYTGMSDEEIDQLRMSIFNSRVQLQAKLQQEVYIKDRMTEEDKALQHLYDNFDTVLNHQGRTDWESTGMSDEQIDELRTQVRDSRAQLKAKLQQGVFVEDGEGDMKLDLDAVMEKFEEEAEEAKYLLSSSSDEEFDEDEDDAELDCAYTFQKEDNLEDFLKTKTGGDMAEEVCESVATIVPESKIDLRALVADGRCNFDSTYGHWYVAECRPPSTDGDDDNNNLPQFVMTKSFCRDGCHLCANPLFLPNILDIPTGPLFRTWNGPSRGVCEVTSVTPTDNSNGMTESLWVQHEGNCIRETCVKKPKNNNE